MKLLLLVFIVAYISTAVLVFTMHTQMPVTFWLAVLRSVLWPLWVMGLLKGSPMPMD